MRKLLLVAPRVLALLCLLPWLCSSRASAQLEEQYAPIGWHSAGQDLANTRNQIHEQAISSANVGRLQKKWIFAAGGDVRATPTVADGIVYFADAAGKLFAIDKADGTLVWSHEIADYTGSTGTISRTSPAVVDKHLYIGDQLGNRKVRTGADLLSIDRNTGALEWITQVESHASAIITGSPVVYNGVIYIGVSSGEEGAAEGATYPCCTFRGSVVAVEASTGKILWKTYTVPDNGGKPGGYSGASVWSPPAVDILRKTIYVGTANNYTAPAGVVACIQANPAKSCTAPDDYFDSLLALDLTTGHIKWAVHMRPYDVWTLACIRPAAPRANCPLPASVDSGSGAGPNLLGNMVGIGQKDGTYWAVNADSGKVLWTTQVGPGGSSGGIQWGTATDIARIYVASANSDGHPYKLIPSGDTITWGAWSALDPLTGKILWQTADPISGSSDLSSVSVANGVLYAGSSSGYMYGLDGKTGKILWNFNSGGSVIDGPAITGSTVFWGSGNGSLSNNKVFAFTLP